MGHTIADAADRPISYRGWAMPWPAHLPNDCPPDDAEPAAGQVFRLVDGKPSEDDFKSHYELDPERAWTDLCLACGLSVFADVTDADKARNRFPALRSRAIAHATLDGTIGVMKPTGKRSHRTWWLPGGCQPWLVFQVSA